MQTLFLEPTSRRDGGSRSVLLSVPFTISARVTFSRDGGSITVVLGVPSTVQYQDNI